MRPWFWIQTASLLLLGSACAGGTPAPSAPSAAEPSHVALPGAGPAAPAATPVAATPAAEHSPVDGDAALLLELKKAKVSLSKGIALAEQSHGAAISAKFELEDGKLSLSVYTAKQGLAADAEHNVLEELSGDPTGSEWKPKTEVFEDAKHITRAAFHLTVLQRAGTTLEAVLAKAAAQQPGEAYSVTPAIKERKPVFHVLVLTAQGKSATVDVDAG